jgi:hypothetical protein
VKMPPDPGIKPRSVILPLANRTASVWPSPGMLSEPATTPESLIANALDSRPVGTEIGHLAVVNDEGVAFAVLEVRVAGHFS